VAAGHLIHEKHASDTTRWARLPCSTLYLDDAAGGHDDAVDDDGEGTQP
jgi:hypothetical protein